MHGKLCASHPWEVIVAFAILAIALFSMGPHLLYEQNNNGQSTTTTTASSALPMAMASEMYFSQQMMADSVAPPPHLSPDSYKSANIVSDDSLSRNRYFRNNMPSQKQQQQEGKAPQHHRYLQQCTQQSMDCAPREVSTTLVVIAFQF